MAEIFEDLSHRTTIQTVNDTQPSSNQHWRYSIVQFHKRMNYSNSNASFFANRKEWFGSN